MKVEFTDEMKRHICIADAPNVRRLIREMDGDEEASYYAKSAANLVADMKRSGGNPEIIRANAEISLNARVKDRYFEGSGNLDVWIEFTAQYWNAFCVGGAYLSDILVISGQEEDDMDIYKRMFVRWFKEER
jgi:hypothetical protein